MLLSSRPTHFSSHAAEQDRTGTALGIRGVRNPMKISDIGLLKTEPNRPQNSKTENLVSAVRFSKKNPLQRFSDGFSRCLVHSSSCSMIASTVNVFFFMPYLCTSSSESLWLTISWTNSAWKYVISSVLMNTEQHTVQKTETAVILVQESPAVADKPARRLQKVCTVYVRAAGL